MLKRIFFSIVGAALFVAFVSAQDATLTIPVKSTPADNGKQMFVNYCAPCHGLDGRGHGPTAAALKTPPTDLSLLSKNNNGAYPATHVIAVLRFGAENPAHGSKLMPVWGPVLQKVGNQNAGPDAQALRVSNLVKYVETIQAK